MEDAVERGIVDELGCVLPIHCLDVVHDRIRDVFQTSVFPCLIEHGKELSRRRGVETRHARHGGMIAHPKLSYRKALEGHVCRGIFLSAHSQSRRHGCLTGCCGPETSLLPDPARTFRRNGLLRELVAKFDLELRAVEPLLTRETRNVELALLLLGALLGKGRLGVNESKFIHRFELFSKFVEGIHREHRRRDGDGIPLFDYPDEVVLENTGSIVEEGGVHLRHPPDETICYLANANRERALSMRRPPPRSIFMIPVMSYSGKHSLCHGHFTCQQYRIWTT